MLVPFFVTINLITADYKKLKQQQKKKNKQQQHDAQKLVYKIFN
tara:strand:+ start:1831 stop:1962 length:132 start_codon:yes stop_codon:yes gene_type:complete